MRVLATHTAGRLETLVAALRADGHEVVHHPRIRTEILPEAREATAALAALPWVLFASRSAVEAWREFRLPFAAGAPRFGAVGSGTAAALVTNGGRATLVAEGTATDLAERFLARADAAGPVGLPRGNRSRPDLPDRLAAAGLAVRQVTSYRTCVLPWRDPGPVDAILFASPSAVEAVPQAVLTATRTVAIGSVTAAALRRRGADPVTAERPDATALRRALQALQPPARTR